MSHSKPLYVEHLACNKRTPYYSPPGRVPTYMRVSQKDLNTYQLPMAPAVVKEHPDPTLQDKLYDSYSPDRYMPKRPKGMPAIELSDEEKVRMHELAYYCGTGPNRLPPCGWQWCEERLKRPRTVDEDDLGNLAEARAKHQRYEHDKPKDAETQTDEPLKMYRLTRSPHAVGDYDKYVSAVVIARNEDEAKFIHPSEGMPEFGSTKTPWWEQTPFGESELRTFPPVACGSFQEWIHPVYVRSTYICDYFGPEKAGHIVSNNFASG